MAIAHMTFQKMLHVFRILGILTNTWPPRPNAGKRELLLRECYYHSIIILFFVVWIPMGMSAYRSRNDIGILMKGLAYMSCLGEAILNMVLCTFNRKELQVTILINLLSNMEEFASTSKDYEKIILQKYVDRYLGYIVFVAASFIIAGITIVVSPLFLPVDFPADVWYPFSTKPLLRRVTIYSIQVFLSSYTGFCFCVDVLITIFLLYSTARIEMLNLELQHATEGAQVATCVRKHQELISFITKIQHAFQHILFKTAFTMAVTVIGGGFPLLYIESSILIPQFLSLILAALQRMYLTAWPANDLKEVSMKLALSAYNMAWVGKSRKLQGDLLMIIQRSQKPLLIQMGGFFPALTLEFFASFVTTVLSYFTTMRAAMNM